MNKAVFLDKDGTLIVDVPYNVDSAKISLYPDAGAALKRLQSAGYKLFIISNQAGVARGFFPEKALDAVKTTLQQRLETAGVRLDGFYYCPHHPDGSVAAYTQPCNCRKPEPGMLLRAAAEHDIDLRQSWMVGDILNDVEAGNRAGCRTILVDRGNETEWLPGPYRTPAYTVRSLAAVAELLDNQAKTLNT